MKPRYFYIKVVLIGILLLAVTTLHYSVIKHNMGLHLLHRELYFIPILLASFWFGMKTGVLTALIASVFYVPHIFVFGDSSGHLITVFFQIIIFILVGFLLGWLVDRQKKIQQGMLRSENLMVLGRAASTIGYEIDYILGALKNETENLKKHTPKVPFKEIDNELNNLEVMVTILKSFLPADDVTLITLNLNDLVKARMERFQPEMKDLDLRFNIELCNSDCQMLAIPGNITTILDNLIQNAMDFSSTGQEIRIKVQCDSTICRLFVKDEGPGVRPEHLSKIFTPLFYNQIKWSWSCTGCM